MKYNVSPLRYPGGKTKLYSYINQIIDTNSLVDCTYIEPFAGGSGLALKLLISNKVNNIILNDFDYAVYAFWHSIITKPEEFCNRIQNQIIDMDHWHFFKNIYNHCQEHDIFDIGYATFFLNRTNRSGIISGGVIGGQNQNGKYLMDCRFNKSTLIEKVKLISAHRSKIKIHNLDANDFIIKHLKKYSANYNALVYLDPPYVKKGPTLYQNYFNYKEHERLSKTISTHIKCPWLITYDITSEISSLYSNYKQELISINYSAGINKKGSELAIFSKNLSMPLINTL